MERDAVLLARGPPLGPFKAANLPAGGRVPQDNGRPEPQPKQLLPFRKRTLLRHAVETAVASMCRPILVVIGAHAELVSLELQIVVEGVEDRRALDAVRTFGADAAQGYAIARPMPLGEIPGWLESYEHSLMGIDPTRINASRS